MSPFEYDEDGHLVHYDDSDRFDWEERCRERAWSDDYAHNADPDHRHPLQRIVEEDPTGRY